MHFLRECVSSIEKDLYMRASICYLMLVGALINAVAPTISDGGVEIDVAYRETRYSTAIREEYN